MVHCCCPLFSAGVSQKSCLSVPHAPLLDNTEVIDMRVKALKRSGYGTNVTGPGFVRGHRGGPWLRPLDVLRACLVVFPLQFAPPG